MHDFDYIRELEQLNAEKSRKIDALNTRITELESAQQFHPIGEPNAPEWDRPDDERPILVLIRCRHYKPFWTEGWFDGWFKHRFASNGDVEELGWLEMPPVPNEYKET